MGYIKLSISCLVIVTTTMLMITYANASRHGEKIHFQDSSELGEFDIDERASQRRGNRNHRGRGLGHQKQGIEPAFQQGLPGVYPIKGPPQAPLVLQQEVNPNTSAVNYNQPSYSRPNNLNKPTGQHILNHPYAHNPFLSKIPVDAAKPTPNINNSYDGFTGTTNQLFNSATPASTTAAYVNPRRFDLFYGSNLLEEEANRVNKTEDTTEISFGDRGLFDTLPHCKQDEILVRTKCRKVV